MDCLYSNHHLYLPLYLNIMRWGPTCFLGHESSPDTSLRLRWISLLIHSFADPSRHHIPDPGVNIWLSETERSSFMTTLLADASLSQLVYTFWENHPDPETVAKFCRQNKKKTTKRILPINSKTFQYKDILPIDDWNKSAGGNSRSRVCVRDI